MKSYDSLKDFLIHFPQISFYLNNLCIVDYQSFNLILNQRKDNKKANIIRFDKAIFFEKFNSDS